MRFAPQYFVKCFGIFQILQASLIFDIYSSKWQNLTRTMILSNSKNYCNMTVVTIYSSPPENNPSTPQNSLILKYKYFPCRGLSPLEYVSLEYTPGGHTVRQKIDQLALSCVNLNATHTNLFTSNSKTTLPLYLYCVFSYDGALNYSIGWNSSCIYYIRMADLHCVQANVVCNYCKRQTLCHIFRIHKEKFPNELTWYGLQGTSFHLWTTFHSLCRSISRCL